MPALRQLDTRRKLYFCFALLCCLNTAIVLWVLSQCSAPKLLTVAVRQKFSGFPQDIFDVRVMVLLAVILSLAATTALAFWLQRALVQPAALALQLARQAASGQLDGHHSVPATLKNNELISTMQEMNAFLSDIVAQTREEGTKAGGYAVDLLRTGRHLASRAQNQGSALRSASSTSMQLCVDAREQAKHIEQARTCMGAVGTAIEAGAPPMAAMGTDLAAINTGIAQCSELQERIAGLSLELNLLSLSAALDASRAGAEGAGLGMLAETMRCHTLQVAQVAQTLKQALATMAQRTGSAGTLLGQASKHIDGAMRACACGAEHLGASAASNAILGAHSRQLDESLAALEQDAVHDAVDAQTAAHTAACLRDQAATLTRTLSGLRLGPAHPAAALIHLAHSNARLTAHAPHPVGRGVISVVPPMRRG